MTTATWKPWVFVIAKNLKVHTIAKEFKSDLDSVEFQRELERDGFSVQRYPAHQAGKTISLARIESVITLLEAL